MAAYSIPLSGPALLYAAMEPIEDNDTIPEQLPWTFLGVSERGVNVTFNTAEEDAATDLAGVPYEVINMGVTAMINCVLKLINNIDSQLSTAHFQWVLGLPYTDEAVSVSDQYPHSFKQNSIGLLHKANSNQPNCLRAFQLAIVNSYKTPQKLNGYIFYCVIPERATWNYRYSQLGLPISWRAYPRLKFKAQPPYSIGSNSGSEQDQDIQFWNLMKRITNESFPIPEFDHV
jgi:hypothetical protein